MLKRLSKSPRMHRVLSGLIAGYVRLVHATSRWTVEGTEDRDRLWDEGRAFIIASWHNRLGMMPFAYLEKAHHISVAASGHRDGRLVMDALIRFGFEGIPVDSKDAAKATRTIVRKLKSGGRVGITPDGPRGPRLIAKEGIVAIAAMTGVPVVPLTYSMRRRRILKTWDRFILPLPFNVGVCRWGKAIEIPRKADAETREAYRRRIEAALNDMTDACDREMGQSPIPRAEAVVESVRS